MSPVCRKCGRMQATAEMRRSTIPEQWLCKDTPACKERQRQNRAAIRANEIANRKGKQK